MSLFDGSGSLDNLRMIEQAMDASMVRRSVIANNIANVDVPHFKRSDVTFEADLKRAREKMKAIEETPPLLTLHDKHYARPSMVDYKSVKPRVHMDYLSQMRNDGNNVDIEEEVTNLTKNQMQYTILVERVGGVFRNLNNMIRLA